MIDMHVDGEGAATPVEETPAPEETTVPAAEESKEEGQ